MTTWLTQCQQLPFRRFEACSISSPVGSFVTLQLLSVFKSKEINAAMYVCTMQDTHEAHTQTHLFQCPHVTVDSLRVSRPSHIPTPAAQCAGVAARTNVRGHRLSKISPVDPPTRGLRNGSFTIAWRAGDRGVEIGSYSCVKGQERGLLSPSTTRFWEQGDIFREC